MKKRMTALILALCVALVWLPAGTLAADASGDFVIENGVLIKYNGAGGDVVIPDGVTGIGEEAFWGSGDGVTSLTLPDSVTSIGEYVLSSFGNLTSFFVGENNPAYKAVEGILFDKAGTVLVQYPAKRSGNEYTVPDGVTVIGETAFAECSGLTSVVLPDSVERIESAAFSMCDRLTGIALPAGMTWIGDHVFAGCDSLKELTIPNGVTSIEAVTFYGCGGLTDIVIPDGVTSIGYGAFAECGGLTSFTIPDSVTDIGGDGFNVFQGCVNLTSFFVGENNPAYKAVEGVLFDKAGTTLVHYPIKKGGREYVIPDGVTDIGVGAFEGCGDLTAVTLPDGVITIGEGAFYGCGGLTSMTLPDSVESVGMMAFSECGALTGVTLLNPGTEFGEYGCAFDLASDALTVYGYTGSTTEAHCEMYGIPFVSLGEAPAPRTALTDSMVSLREGYAATYDKTAHTPAVTVKDGETVLTADTDYTVTYENNTNAGKATITVRGKGDYKGTVTRTFIIDPAALAGTAAVTLTGDSDGDGEADVGDILTLELTDGRKLTAEGGDVMLKDGDTAISVTVAWLRDDKPIEGAAGVSYTLINADKGRLITVQVKPQDTDNYTGMLTAAFPVPADKPHKPDDTGSDSESGGSGDPGSTVTKRAVSVDKAANGSVSLSAKSAGKGDIVTVTVTPDKGCRLESLKVTDGNGKMVALTDMGEGKYTFTMPGTAVKVKSVFLRETAPEEPTKEPSPETRPNGSITARFGDVKETDWFGDAVQYVFDKGMMTGLTEDTFGPGVHTSRAMVVTILYRLAGEPEAAQADFPDVPADRYYRNAVSWAVENGIVNGFEDNTFRPDDDITREQLAVMLYRYASYQGRDVTARARLSEYSDAEQISAYAFDALSWGKAVGMISGTDWGGLHPGGSATRAETAAILMRYGEKKGGEAGCEGAWTVARAKLVRRQSRRDFAR